MSIIRIEVRVDDLATITLSDFGKMLSPPNTSRSPSFTNILNTTDRTRNQIDNIGRSAIQIFIRQEDMISAIHMRFTVIQRQNIIILKTFNLTSLISTFIETVISKLILILRKIATEASRDANCTLVGPVAGASRQPGTAGFPAAS